MSEMNPVTIKEAKMLIKRYYEGNTPWYLHGSFGIGKSAANAQTAKELGIGFIDQRATRMLPEDVNGIPVPDLQKRMAVWLEAAFWPRVERDGPRGIICFDELSDVGKNVQTALYSVILDRKIGDFRLPDGWIPCAAGNRREDRAAAQSLSLALADRFAHMDVVVDYPCFREYANAKKLHPFIVGFLKFRPNLLHVCTMEGGIEAHATHKAMPSPRSWEECCKYVNDPPSLRHKLMRGIVGPAAAGEFETFVKGINLPNLEEILADPKRCRIPKEPSSKYALAVMLEQNTDRKNFAPISTYIKRDEFGRDFEIMTVLEAIRLKSEIMETKAYVDFSTRHQDIHL